MGNYAKNIKDIKQVKFYFRDAKMIEETQNDSKVKENS